MAESFYRFTGPKDTEGRDRRYDGVRVNGETVYKGQVFRADASDIADLKDRFEFETVRKGDAERALAVQTASGAGPASDNEGGDN